MSCSYTKCPKRSAPLLLPSLALRGGALKSAKTTPLLTFEEGQEAMKQAGKSGYRRQNEGVFSSDRFPSRTHDPTNHPSPGKGPLPH
jgi:hypothetical protein